MYCKTLTAAVVAALFVTAQAANAVTVMFERVIGIEAISGPNGAGLSVGDEFVFQITVDNGGSLENNSWSDGDIVSASVTSGAFSGVFNAPYYGNDPIFSTNGSGVVTVAAWFDIDENNTDSVGGNYFLQAFSNALIGSDSSFYDYDSAFGNESLWTASVAAVPLPAALPLLLVALGGMGFAARRRKAT